MNEKEKKQANLRVLQRLDPSVLDIVCGATHVVLYEFSQQKQHWEKKNVEGSLFITKRASEPLFKLLVLNRSSTQNLEVPIGINFQMQVREPYLIFRSQDGDATIRGLWFHDNNERCTVSGYLERIVEDSKGMVSDNDKHTLNEQPPQQQTPPPQQQQPEMTKRDVATGTTPSLATNASTTGGTVVATPNKKVDSVEADIVAEALLSPLSLGTAPQETNQPGLHLHRQQHMHHATPYATPEGPMSSPSVPHYRNVVLDKKSLQLSLLALIQDEKFLDLIHAQYLKVAHSRAHKKDGKN